MNKRFIALILLFYAAIFAYLGITALNYFLVPRLEKDFRDYVVKALGDRAEISSINFNIYEGSAHLKGLRLINVDWVKYKNFLYIDKVDITIDTVSTFLNKRLT